MKAFTFWNTNRWELIGVALLFGGWAALSVVTGQMLLPSPMAVVAVLGEIISQPVRMLHMISSIYRGSIGIGTAVIMGAIFGFAAGRKPWIEALMRPTIAVMKAVPVVSVIILMIFWIPSGGVPMLIGFTIAFPVVYHGVLQGTHQVDRRLLEMAKVFRVSENRVLIGVFLPSVVPYLMGALDSAIGIGWKSVVAAEVICQPQYGIGTMLMNAKYNLAMEQLFAWTLLAVLISYIAEHGVRAASRSLNRWRL